MNTVFDFFKEIVNLIGLSSNIEDEEDKKRVFTTKEAYRWLMDEIKNPKSKRVQVHHEPFPQVGKIYIFKYDPKHKNEMDYWDRHPIVLVLGYLKRGSEKHMIGLNISWYPPEARKFLIESIRKIYTPNYGDAILKKSFRANDQKPVYLDLYRLKTQLDLYGLSFAIREYIPQRMRVPRVCVCYEDWDKAILLDQPRIFPELKVNNPHYNLKNIYLDFKYYVKHQRENRTTIKEKRDLAKRLGKYKFIK